MWSTQMGRGKEFAGGMDDRIGAVAAAVDCRYFRSDVEEELVVDDPVSCYNCRYRRWTFHSFACMKSS